MSVVNRLNDECFNIATDAIHGIIQAFESEIGRKPSLAELCEILTWGARPNADNLLDGPPDYSITITGGAAKPKARLTRGELIAVPVDEGRWAPILHVGLFGRFGNAFGIFDGCYHLRELGNDWEPQGLRPYPVFSGARLVRSGRWLVVCTRRDLIPRFRSPEMFHHPDGGLRPGANGEFGLAESLDGIRKLSAHEMAPIFEGLAVQDRQFFGEDRLEEFLAMRCSRTS